MELVKSFIMLRKKMVDDKNDPDVRPRCPYKPSDLLTRVLTFSSNSSLFSRHMRAASTFAGDSSLGSASMLMTLINIFSTLWMGDQRSEACS